MVITRQRRTPTEHVADGVHRIRLGFVSAYLVESDDGLVLVDSGEAGGAARIADGVHRLGRTVHEIRHLLMTHHHPDHTGGLAELSRRTGAPVYAHPADVPYIQGERTWSPSGSGAVGRLLAPVLSRIVTDPAEPARVHHQLSDGQHLDIAGGMTALHTPGHTPGHVAFLLPRDGGVLIAGDAATNAGRVRSGGHRLAGIVSDDLRAAARSFERLAGLDFEVAVFGHGAPIRAGAAARFRSTMRR